jgi:hypothetical protein
VVQVKILKAFISMATPIAGSVYLGDELRYGHLCRTNAAFTLLLNIDAD